MGRREGGPVRLKGEDVVEHEFIGCICPQIDSARDSGRVYLNDSLEVRFASDGCRQISEQPVFPAALSELFCKRHRRWILSCRFRGEARDCSARKSRTMICRHLLCNLPEPVGDLLPGLERPREFSDGEGQTGTGICMSRVGIWDRLGKLSPAMTGSIRVRSCVGMTRSSGGADGSESRWARSLGSIGMPA